MAEHPRLDYLLGLAYASADNAHGVFEANAGDRRAQENTDKVQGSFLYPAGLLGRKVLGPRYR
jgi:hypothetical protein